MIRLFVLAWIGSLVLTGCGGDSSGSGAVAVVAHSIGGTVSGLTGSGLVLHDNANDDLSVTGNGSFNFSSSITSGSTYAVTVKSQPSSPTQVCAVANGSGTVGTTNITDISIACTVSVFTVGGTVSGLTGSGLVLQDNAGDDLIVSGDGTFTFSNSVASGAAYAVIVKAPPSSPTQVCSVASGSGTIGTTSITNVSVSCTVSAFTVGGSVSGLAGSGLILEDNAGNDLSVTINGSFGFSKPIASGTRYAVTVKSQPSPPMQVCTVANGSSIVGATNITTVSISCAVSVFTVGGNVSGLTGSGLVLQNNAGNDLGIAANGSFAFSNSVASGNSYSVTIKSQPSSPAQVCTVGSAVGTVGAGNVSNVAVDCAAAPVSCIRVVHNLLDDNLSGYGQAGASVGFQNGGQSATFNLTGSSTNFSLLGGDLSLVSNTRYAVRFTVSGYAGNYPGANLEILGATPDVFSGVTRLSFNGDGTYAIVFNYAGPTALYIMRIGLNVEDSPNSATPQGGFTLSDGMWEPLSSAAPAPSEFVAGGHAWAFNYPSLNTYDPTTGLVQEARGPDCANTYKNVWAVTADSFGYNAYDFPQQLANNIATNYAFYVDSVPGRKLSVAQMNVDPLLSNSQLPANVAKPNGIIVEGGVNDIVQDTAAQQLEAVTGSIISDVESKNLSAILITISPFGKNANWTSSREQVRVAYNQWVRAQASQQNRIYVYDMAAGLAAGGIADDNNPTILAPSIDVGDGLHPNGIGGLQIATGVKHILDAQSQ
jgi:hypothetical protein